MLIECAANKVTRKLNDQKKPTVELNGSILNEYFLKSHFVLNDIDYLLKDRMHIRAVYHANPWMPIRVVHTMLFLIL